MTDAVVLAVNTTGATATTVKLYIRRFQTTSMWILFFNYDRKPISGKTYLGYLHDLSLITTSDLTDEDMIRLVITLLR